MVMAVPSCWVRDVVVAAAPFVSQDAVVVSLVKGIEQRTLATMSQVVSQVLVGRPVGVLTGPNLAAEIAMGLPAATVVASACEHVASELQELFSLPHLRVYTNDDVVGCELAGSVKNVLALGAGMVDGLGAGANARAAIITRGLAEMSRLGVAMGGHPLTFSGLAGLGDVVLTCTSERSRNRKVGFLLGSGHSLRDVLAGTNQVAEGVTTAASVVGLGCRHKVELPICEQVAAVLEGSRRPEEAVAALLGRQPTHERAGLGPWEAGFPATGAPEASPVLKDAMLPDRMLPDRMPSDRMLPDRMPSDRMPSDRMPSDRMPSGAVPSGGADQARANWRHGGC
jgi:glycerol-3-phosphate dehydrogenase (NAD(P)+)